MVRQQDYLSRDDVQFDYTLAMGTIEDYRVGTDLIDSLSNTDMPTPEFQNNYFDFIGSTWKRGKHTNGVIAQPSGRRCDASSQDSK